MVREVHPEVCFRELTGAPMTAHKSSAIGRQERRQALAADFPGLAAIEAAAKVQALPIENVLDATVACWSAHRLATGCGRIVCDADVFDSAGLWMAIWVWAPGLGGTDLAGFGLGGGREIVGRITGASPEQQSSPGVDPGVVSTILHFLQ